MNNAFKFLGIGHLCCLMALAIVPFTGCAPKAARKSVGRYPDRNLAKPDAGDTGIDLAAYAKEQFPHLPVVIVSGQSHVVPPGVQFLAKPFRVAELLEAVNL